MNRCFIKMMKERTTQIIDEIKMYIDAKFQAPPSEPEPTVENQ